MYHLQCGIFTLCEFPMATHQCGYSRKVDAEKAVVELRQQYPRIKVAKGKCPNSKPQRNVR